MAVVFRSAKPRNRPTFRQVQMHLEIAGPDWQRLTDDEFHSLQVPKCDWSFCILTMAHASTKDCWQDEWKEEIRLKMESIKCGGSHYAKVEEDLINRRRDELRHAQDVREHYERKLERANSLYMDLTACMLQLEKRERELLRFTSLSSTISVST